MRKVNKRREHLAALLAAVLLISLFPAVHADEQDPGVPAGDVTPVAQDAHHEVTKPDPTATPTPAPTPTPTPTPTPAPTPTPEPTAEPTPEPVTEAPAEETTPEPTPTPAPEASPDVIEEQMTPDPESVLDSSDDEDEAEEDEEKEAEEEDEDEGLFEFDDDYAGEVSEELLEQFNNPETFEHVEFGGTADIVLKEKTYTYGQTVTLQARVRGVEISYRMVWEACDRDERGWFTIGSGSEYSFVVTPEIMDREYRVVLYTVD